MSSICLENAMKLIIKAEESVMYVSKQQVSQNTVYYHSLVNVSSYISSCQHTI